jgi:hypothetical protein
MRWHAIAIFPVLCLAILACAQVSPKEWQTRAAEFNQIANSKDLDKKSSKLIDLLKIENQVVDRTLKDSNGEHGVSATLGEEYVDYYSNLFESVLKVAKSGAAQEAYAVLAAGAYDPSSAAAREVLGRSDLAFPTLAKQAKSPMVIKRAQAVEMLGKVATHHQSALSTRQRAELKNLLGDALKDRALMVRSRAVNIVAEAGYKDFLPQLSDIAENDPGTLVRAGSRSYPVREEAKKAVELLK